MKAKYLAAIVVMTIVLSASVFLMTSTGKATSSTNINSASTSTSSGNIFMGKITNSRVQLSPGTVEGTTTYDANCVGQDVTQCDAGIRTNEYGTLDFHSSHRMAVQPCLHIPASH